MSLRLTSFVWAGLRLGASASVLALAATVVLAGCGVLWVTFNYGSFPWIALCLAGSFALYGLIRKLVPIDPILGLGAETVARGLPRTE